MARRRFRMKISDGVSAPVPAVLKTFLRHLAVSGKAKGTIQRYREALALFLGYFDNRDSAEITSEMIDEFLEDVRLRRSAASVNLMKSAIRGFFGYLLDTDHLSKDPSRLVRNEKIVRKDPAIFSPAQLRRFFETIKAAIGSPANYRAARDHALYCLAYNAGLRAGVELLALDIKDVEERVRLVVLGKGKKLRRIPLNQTARTAIAEYLAVRKTFPAKDARALFVSRRGTRLGIRAVEQNLKTWLKRAGITEDFWPHIFRHTCGTYLQARNKDLRVTQEFLGHSSPTTTAIYAHATPKALEEAADSL